MKIRITIEAEAAEDIKDLRSLNATAESIRHWATEEFGEAKIQMQLVDELYRDEEFDRMLDEARYGALGQG